MQMECIKVPLELLLSRELTPAAKFLWVVSHLDATKGRERTFAPTQLARRTGLARATIYEALSRLSTAGWIRMFRVPSGRELGERRWQTVLPPLADHTHVELPIDLIDLVDTPNGVRPQALLCFGLLQTAPVYRKGVGTGQFKWAELSQLTGLNIKTVKRAVRALAEAGWVTLRQQNRVKEIQFRLVHADEMRMEAVRKRLEEAEHLGEALMQENLLVIVASKNCVPRFRAVFLKNPVTDELLEIDLYYFDEDVGFEFNGPQHYKATGRFTKAEVAAQKKRDAIKRKICADKEIPLVIVHAEDLSIEGMLKKVGDLLPLRKSLRGFERTIRFLETVNANYRRAARRARGASGLPATTQDSAAGVS